MAEDTPNQEPRTYGFNAEVRQLLDLVIHSLYSDREIFLRELISNASDALDRGRFLGLQRDDLRPAAEDAGITISVDEDAGTITLTDDGVGLTADEAIEHLGTIARSGTKAFAQALAEQDGGDASTLIGQFGVGFYSALMVSERVEVRSLSALPDAEPIVWSCDGSTDYTLRAGEREQRGTDVVLHLREDAREFLDPARVRAIVKKHSEYVAWPIRLVGEDGPEQINEPQALWTRSPSDVEDDDYKAFYKQLTGDWSEPAVWAHIRADVPMQYKAILYVPTHAPMDLNYADGRRIMRLYARRVLIQEEARKLLPDYLRFMRGVVDSEDLQLNVSREMVQKTPTFAKLGEQLTSRVLKRLKQWAKKDPEDYAAFWREFGPVVKEGLHNDPDNRTKLLELVRFRSTRGDDDQALVSLAEYVEAMPEGQDAIWYLTGPDWDTVTRSPHLEAFRRKGYEVLLLTDPIDEWVVQSVSAYEDKPLKSASRGELDLGDEDDAPTLDEGLVGWLGEVFSGDVKSVRSSHRLTDAPSVLVDDTFGVSGNMERILRSMQQDLPPSMRILEVNPRHPWVLALDQLHSEGRDREAEPIARLLLDHAQLVEGQVQDVGGLVARLRVLGGLAAKGLGVELPEEAPAEEAPTPEAPVAEEAAPDSATQEPQPRIIDVEAEEVEEG